MGIYGKAIFVKVRYINTLTISLYPIYIHKVFPVTPQKKNRNRSTSVAVFSVIPSGALMSVISSEARRA